MPQFPFLEQMLHNCVSNEIKPSLIWFVNIIQRSIHPCIWASFLALSLALTVTFASGLSQCCIIALPCFHSRASLESCFCPSSLCVGNFVDPDLLPGNHEEHLPRCPQTEPKSLPYIISQAVIVPSHLILLQSCALSGS